MKEPKRGKVLILVNHDIVIYNFRLELVEKLLEMNFEVIISSPYGERIADLISIGCKYENVEMNRHGLNPINEYKLLKYYKKLIKKYNPNVVLGYTIKPNIYGAIAVKHKKIPFIANITGLGTGIESGGILKKIIVLMYRSFLKNVEHIFLQNHQNLEFFYNMGFDKEKCTLLPGSGVNLERYYYSEYPLRSSPIIINVIGRLMKDKGTDEIFEAIPIICERYSNVKFRFVGFCDEEKYNTKVKQITNEYEAEYLGLVKDVRHLIAESNVLLHASHHEGMSNVILETASIGRPVIASNISGCNEAIEEGKTGFLFEPGNVESMIKAIEKFLKLNNEEMREMGVKARKKMELEFDRNIVVNAYINEISKYI